MKPCLLFLLLIVSLSARGQSSFAKKFANNYENNISSVTEAPDMGYLVAGTTRLNYLAKQDIILTKVDSTGGLQWVKAYGNTIENVCLKVITMRSGGFMLAGYTKDSAGLGDILLMKVDDTGKLLWSKVYGSTIRIEQARDIRQAINGDLLIVGSVTGYQDTEKTYFIRTDSAGNVLYTSRFLVGTASNGRSVLELSDQSVVIGGDVYGAEVTDNTASDAYILKLDPSGNPLWAKAYNLGWEDNLTSVVEAYGGGFTILTHTYDDIYEYSGMIRTTAAGDTMWMKLYNGPFYPLPGGLIQTKDSGYVMTASALFLKMNESGTVQVAKLVKKSGTLTPAIERKDSSLALFGTIYNYPQVAMFAGATDVNYSVCSDSIMSISHPSGTHLLMVPSVVAYGPMDSVRTIMINTLPFSLQQTDLCDPLTVSTPSASFAINVYPNPASDQLSISFPDYRGGEIMLSICDITGRVIYRASGTITTFAATTHVDVSQWIPGVYFVEMKSDLFLERRKIIIN